MTEYCDLCDHSGFKRILDLSPDLLFSGTIYRCAHCGLMVKMPLPDKSKLGELYCDNYAAHPFFKKHIATSDKGKKRMLQRAISGLESPRSSRIRFLDIGCGQGEMMVIARDLGLDVTGVDPCQVFSNQLALSGFRIVSEFFEASELEPVSFDIVCLWEILEHVVSPDKVLAQAILLLRPGGRIMIRTPNHDDLITQAALFMARLGRSHIVRHPVNIIFGEFHTYFFTASTLLKYLAKHCLEITHWEYSGYNPGNSGIVNPLESIGVRLLSMGDRIMKNGFYMNAICEVREL